MRRLATVLVGAALLASCGGGGDQPPAPPALGPGTTELEVVFGAEIHGAHVVYSTFSVRLRCDPPDGTVVDPRAACERLEAEPDLLISPPAKACDRPPTDWDVTVRGSYRGRPVEAVFSRCHQAEVVRWMRVVDFEIPVPGI